MKKVILSIAFLIVVIITHAQTGTIWVEKVHSLSLQNKGGENPVRRVTVYLPPNYDKSNLHYPVIYFLHGFGWSDSLLIANDHMDQLLDKAIASGKIKPVIVVFPNEYTLYKGSFYTNSSLTGNWSDFTAKDLVTYIDKTFRTLPNRESRGIAGHSMGGHGAIKIGMLFPDVFSSVYALSPAILGLSSEFDSSALVYKRAQQIKTMDEMVTGWTNASATLVIALGRAFSPNPSNPPFFTDLPFTYKGDSLVVHKEVLELWKKNLPLTMIDSNLDNLRKLKALKLDWGRNDEFKSIPITCLLFSKKLEQLHINHYAEEYIGTHGSKVCTDDGRFINELLPFFDTNLKFGETTK